MAPAAAARTAFGPGRVNLVGDHTDYNGGLALPMAIDLGVTVSYEPQAGDELRVTSQAYGRAAVPLGVPAVADDLPPWARPVAAVIELARPETAGDLSIAASLPAGAGLSSSAALCVAVARVLGVGGTPLQVARLCREAERRAGAPVGLMDPWVCAGARAGCALLLDFAAETARHVPLPHEVELVVVDSGRPRTVRGSGYAARVAECEAAAGVVGPLPSISHSDLAGLRDPILRRRARHVVSECERVRSVADAFAAGDLAAAGARMTESHWSLSADFQVSTPELDALVSRISAVPGVLGARLTGAGFGGCVVVLTRPGALGVEQLGKRAWRVVPSDGAYARRRAGTS